MKVRVNIDVDPVHVDEVVEGRDDEEVFRRSREELERRAPFMIRLAMKGMSDDMIRRRVVEAYNQRFGANESVPNSAAEFLAFGERAGFITRLD